MSRRGIPTKKQIEARLAAKARFRKRQKRKERERAYHIRKARRCEQQDKM